MEKAGVYKKIRQDLPCLIRVVYLLMGRTGGGDWSGFSANVVHNGYLLVGIM
jgi:hypothetical protein